MGAGAALPQNQVLLSLYKDKMCLTLGELQPWVRSFLLISSLTLVSGPTGIGRGKHLSQVKVGSFAFS